MRTYKEVVYFELLVLRCRRGDKGAWEELVRKWDRSLLYYLRRLVDNEQDAWDILQQVWLEALKRIGSLREPASLPAWLYRIARNKAASRLREEKAESALLENSENLALESNNDNSLRFEDADRVHCGLARLSLPHREVLTLYFLEGFSVDEIAGIVRISPGTVKSRLHYAKAALRENLKRKDFDYA